MKKLLLSLLLFVPLFAVAQNMTGPSGNGNQFNALQAIRYFRPPIQDTLIALKQLASNSINGDSLGAIVTHPGDSMPYRYTGHKWERLGENSNYVTLITDQEITGTKTFTGFLDKNRTSGAGINIIGFSTAGINEWNLGVGTAVNDFYIKNVLTNFVALNIDAITDYIELDKSLRLKDTEDSSLGVIYKNEDRFLHNFKNTGAEGENVFLGRESGNFTMGIGGGISSQSSFNTGLGTLSLNALTTGWSNVGVGYRSLGFTTSGKYNTGIGVHALDNTTTADRNTAIGHYAGFLNITGAENTITGASAGRGNTTGSFNCYYGVESGYTADASYNSAFGHNSLNKTTGSFNQAFGKNALQDNLSGQENNAFGFGALGANTTGNNNSAFGQNAGSANTTGSGNIFLGFGAGFYETASNKLFIDNQNRASEADGRAKALIYGVFDAATSNQIVTVNGSFIVNGSLSGNIITVTGNTTLDATHQTIIFNNAGAAAANLPVASTCTGRFYTLKKISSTLNDVIVTRAGADLIDGATTKVLTLQNSAITIQSTGSGWVILNSYADANVL